MKGDLDAAQQALASLWPLFNVVKQALLDGAQDSKGIAAAIEQAQADLAPLYLKAMGDDVSDPKPTAK